MQTIIIGLDAFDPKFFEQLHSEGKLPHLSAYLDRGGYSRMSVANPPQSEVSWTSIATGTDPGSHGIFDFVHRNPVTYGLEVSLLPTKKSPMGLHFVPPHRAKTLFEAAVEAGYPATSLWWPATFPAKLESPVRTIPGLGAPDILGRLGVGTLFSVDPGQHIEKEKTNLEKLEALGAQRFTGMLEGPTRKTLSGTKVASVPIELELLDEEAASLRIENESNELKLGKWSPIVEMPFKLGFGIKIKAVTRAILTQISPEPILYFLPLQIHPLHSAWSYGAPKGFLKELWTTCGPFLTLGWPQDTTGLEEGIINDKQFLALCDLVFEERQKVFWYLLEQFNEGVLACVFDTLDRVQHMFWRDHPDIIEKWYQKLDAFVGRVEDYVGSKKDIQGASVLVLSDHGFDRFNFKVHLNRWLIEQGFLTAKETEGIGSLQETDWSQTRAYAIGLNSIYLNQAGREGQGVVSEEERAETLKTLRKVLLAWRGPDGKQVVKNITFQADAFEGPLAKYGPDMVVGYAPGYRASAETGLGEWERESIVENKDHWGADHCFDAGSVPGVLFSNKGLEGRQAPSFRDIPELALGKAIRPGKQPPAPTHSDEDQDVVMERLKDLGYL